MADFENFESTGEPNVEEDPAADFLAREQTELAGLEDDNFAIEESSQPSEATAGNGFNAFEESTAASDAQAEDAPQVSVETGLIDPGPEMEHQPSQPSFFFDTEEPPQTNGPTDGGGYAAIAQADKHRQEPEKIRIWREEQKKRLEQKDAEEEVKNNQWREAAKKELEDWLKHHAEQLVKTKENNRAQEEASNKERDETIAGQEWEKICRLCDFNPKHSKNTKDVSRMRSILLQLKQTPLTMGTLIMLSA
ncbi:CLTB [Acanthosepion pharaonis]|uniref:Clathrin light chain n=1 Tax=Acanthosepion pharaonis TaxID=158019 RepID=A0A812AYZ2_ACAPH|nr:CLTB [Sepia pharaonis]